MQSSDVYWHIYHREQIKPEWRGRLVYVLEVPPVAGVPIIRDIFDPTGADFPSNTRSRISAVLEGQNHGIVYAGVNKGAVYNIMKQDPLILAEDSDFARYNRELVTNSRHFFLINPHLGLNLMAGTTLCLVTGSSMVQRRMNLQR